MGHLNIEIPDDLHQDLKVISAKRDTPMKEMVIDALEDEFSAENDDAENGEHEA